MRLFESPNGSVLVLTLYPSAEIFACGGMLARTTSVGRRAVSLWTTTELTPRQMNIGHDFASQLQGAYAEVGLEFPHAIEIAPVGQTVNRAKAVSFVHALLNELKPSELYLPHPSQKDDLASILLVSSLDAVKGDSSSTCYRVLTYPWQTPDFVGESHSSWQFKPNVQLKVGTAAVAKARALSILRNSSEWRRFPSYMADNTVESFQLWLEIIGS